MIVIIIKNGERMSVSIDNIYYLLDQNDLTASVADNKENTELPTDLVIPSTVINEGITYKVTSIVDKAFYQLSSIQSLTLNENLIRVGENAFDQGRISLDVLTLPSSLQEIANYAFSANKIKRVIIPASLKKIGFCPFGENLIEAFEVDQNNQFFCNDYQFALYDKKLTRLIQVPNTAETFIVPASVYFFDEQSFNMIYSLRTVYINGNIKKHAANSFHCCSGLQTIYYSGRRHVDTIIYNCGNPKIIACYDYQGNFSNIIVEREGACASQATTCKIQKRHSINAIPFFLTMFLS